MPIVLEINDLETVISEPNSQDRHIEQSLSNIDLADENLLNPYSDLWSQLLGPIAQTLPVLVTHNKNLDAHFDNRCLYMRNLKDEGVFNPNRYDRDKVRAELGFKPHDRVILFGGLLRKHKGIYELVELVERLGDERYKLLFVGSRKTPDQSSFVREFGERVRVLPPQNAEAMARINFAADLVILWLDPDVPASHYQMPYKATDALAMGPTIIANDISDLGSLGHQGYLRLAPFGDWDRIIEIIHDVFANAQKTDEMRAASRRLYLRQFSYFAARASFELAARRALMSPGSLPAAEAFAKRFNEFYQKVTGNADEFAPITTDASTTIDASITTDAPITTDASTTIDASITTDVPTTSDVPPTPDVPTTTDPSKLLPPSGMAAAKLVEDPSIVFVNVEHADELSFSDKEGVAVILPCINRDKALETARILVKRAGMATRIFVVEDTIRQGFIKTLNQMAERLEVKYVVYLAEDAFPGVDWLKIAYDELEGTGKGLLAFNCGKWRGRIAAFGMVRREWVKSLYGGAILFPGYKAHRADNELTAIARATGQFVYLADAVVTEVDARKAFRVTEGEAANFTMGDKQLFIRRFNEGFDGLVSAKRLAPIRDEYLNQQKLKKKAVFTGSLRKC